MTQPTTLITGSAKRLGATLARHLAAQGHSIVLHYRRSEAEAQSLAHELRAAGTQVDLVRADLADTAMLAGFWNGLPPVTHLVHNAASFTREPFAEFTAPQLRHHLATNLEAPLLLCQGFLKQLPDDAQGSVTVIGDGAQGWSISPNFFPYAVSKHAWTSVIDLLAAALAPRARANLVALGPTLPGELDDTATFQRFTAAAPLNRLGTPEDVCAAVAFLLAQPTITGQKLSLAGGFDLPAARPTA
jgi:NAD(P)-dependent dehydrogenase (short-subunit alcohol dehydrogenase family)